VENASLADDLLQGVAQIADYIGRPARNTYYLAEKGLIPAFKFGGKWCARKSSLNRYVDELEAKFVA
jgi:excisionase family DNA binding protein